VPSRAQSWRAAAACQASACRDAVQCGAACQLVPCRAVPCRAVPSRSYQRPTTRATRSHIDIPGLSCQMGAPPPLPGGSGWRRSGPVCSCTTAQTHTTPRRPTAPRRAPPEGAVGPTAPASIFPPRRRSWGPLRRLGPVWGGGALRARLGAWAVWLSDGSGWCWSAKQ